jgi:hypothetical protein
LYYWYLIESIACCVENYRLGLDEVTLLRLERHVSSLSGGGSRGRGRGAASVEEEAQEEELLEEDDEQEEPVGDEEIGDHEEEEEDDDDEEASSELIQCVNYVIKVDSDLTLNTVYENIDHFNEETGKCNGVRSRGHVFL